MLRFKILSFFSLTILLSVLLLHPRPGESSSVFRRLTNTAEQSLNLNPILSDDGQIVAFETTADVAITGTSASVHTVRGRVTSDAVEFGEIGRTRGQPSLSADGGVIAFASFENLLGKNEDRNSEIFLHDGNGLKQLTETLPTDESTRLEDGNFQPSISGDGRFVVFSSNRSLVGSRAESRRSIYLIDILSNVITKLITAEEGVDCTAPKIGVW